MSQRDTEIAGNLTNPEVWVRLLFMILFAGGFYIAAWVGAAVALIQVGFKLITGKPVPRLAMFGTSLARFLGQIAVFETFGSDQWPWPFAPWPDGSRATPSRPGAAGPASARTRRTRVVRTAGRKAQDENDR